MFQGFDSSSLHIAIQSGVNFKTTFIKSFCAQFIDNLLGNHVDEVEVRIIFSFFSSSC